MTDVPAGWYDDPEHASQYRYWDGAMWTEHRAPKSTPSRMGDGEGPFEPVTQGLALLRQTWVPLLVISLVSLVILATAAVMAFVALEIAVEPGVFDILERVTEPGWDPSSGTADRAYIDAIEFDFSLGVVLLLVGAAIVGYGGSLAAYAVATLLLAATHAGRALPAGRYVPIALRRLPRWIGIYLLWILVALVPVALLVGVWAVAIQAPVLLVLIIPATLAALVFFWPYMHMSYVTLVLAPTNDPPFRRVLALLNGRWGSIALRIFLLNVVLFAISIAGNVFSLIPVAGIIFSLIVQAVSYAVTAAATVVLYAWAGGPIADDLLDPNASPALLDSDANPSAFS